MRIRIQEDGIDKFKVYLPDENQEFPIGLVWKDPMLRGAWKSKAYFPMHSMDKYVEDKTYDDFMKAARELANTYNRNVIFNDNNDNNDIFDSDYNFSWHDASD